MTTSDPSLADFAREHTSRIGLRDGTRLVVRPILPDDKGALIDGLARLSPESRYRRFMSPMGRFSEAQLRYLTEIDYDDHFAWVAFTADDPAHRGVGVARYIRDRDDHEVAEPAVAIVDDFQGRGLGTLLLDMLAVSAVEHGVRRFRAYVQQDNQPMRDLLEAKRARFEFDEPGVLRAAIPLPTGAKARALLARDLLRSAVQGAVARARHRLTERR